MRYRGTALVRRAAQAASRARCSPVVVVLGARAREVALALSGLDVKLVRNSRWREGIGSSVRAGVREARGPDVSAVLLIACDQPALSGRVLERLVRRFDGHPRSRVASGYAGSIGIPALFGRAWIPELLRCRGDRGAKRLLSREAERVVSVPWPAGARDVDRAADLAR